MAGKKLNVTFWCLASIATGLILALAALMASRYLPSSLPPNEFESHWQKAQEANTAHDSSEAAFHLTECLQSCPFNAGAHFLLARNCRRAGQMNQWRNHLEQAATLRWPEDQIDLEWQLRRAQIGDIWEVEESLLNRLNTRPPDEVIILEALVHGLMLNDRLVDVLLLTSTWIDSFPDDWLALLYRGDARLRLNGNTDEAIQDFKRALDLKPDISEGHLFLAMVLANTGDFKNALPHFQACVSRLSEDPRVLFGLAYCQYSLGRSSEARATLIQLFAVTKDHAAGFFLQAKIELSEEAPEQAYLWMKKADKLAPNEVDVTNALIQVCQQLGKTQEALKYQRLLEEVRTRDADLDKLATAVKSRPDDAEPRFQLGMACLKLGRNLEASHWFQGILWKDPKHLPTLNALADHYKLMNNQKLAAHYRRKAESASGKGVVKTSEGSLRK
jgi:tetratricopeptide (TPR) repeat protein